MSNTILVDVKEVAQLLQAVIAQPEKFKIVQSDCDTGTAMLGTFGDKQAPYNKLSVSITYIDKTVFESTSGESV